MDQESRGYMLYVLILASEAEAGFCWLCLMSDFDILAITLGCRLVVAFQPEPQAKHKQRALILGIEVDDVP
jgi:hypothetical protein